MHTFTLDKMYSSDDNDLKVCKYSLSGFVCFLGAHYMTFWKHTVSNKEEWRLYDDHKPIKAYFSWSQIVHEIVTRQIQPTLLFYQKTEVFKLVDVKTAANFISDEDLKELTNET